LQVPLSDHGIACCLVLDDGDAGHVGERLSEGDVGVVVGGELDTATSDTVFLAKLTVRGQTGQPNRLLAMLDDAAARPFQFCRRSV